MRNLISRNELASWKWDEKATIDQKYDQVSEYFQCISDCEIIDQNARRVCRHILTEQEANNLTEQNHQSPLYPNGCGGLVYVTVVKLVGPGLKLL